MMSLLRSRRMMILLVAVVTVGLVASGAVGLFNAFFAQSDQQQEGEAPVPAPEMAALGEAPDATEYADLGQQCERGECYRVVAITAEEADSGEEAVETVYRHLIDDGWGRILPEGADSPDDVPLSQTYLTNGSVLVQGSTSPYTPGSTAGLVIAHAQDPLS
ncbi:hypothetical protein CDO52_03595 [Nocardiopsis gilva YIM 90087]|uniref:Uncharacterized protein n=1 Tax=Nocardiopsis gilva YIM 90087 TaxID=1235441 RepID=A0A223S1J4_9ACTN|nr:hypothetical protein [Nocardiopsis gilva]ASU81986.1 hypothetical protein CDO52_03595 [Nocardiopsis gilva YIM 90087]